MIGHGVRLLVLAAIAVASTAAEAAKPEWLKLQAPSFGVVSQLDEDDTRRWAVEFDQFIGAMHALYKIEEVDLPPLTIVLFRQNKEFAPYYMRTESGQVRVEGFFGRTDDWSVIGVSGAGRDRATRRVIYHEAVHWFTSATPTELPLWFAEGLAEVLSTFSVVDGKGRWGEAIDGHVEYLAYAGLTPLGDLLHASQDQALHGRGNSRYYPQSWAFVHYLLFGNGGGQRQKLADFLKQQQTTDLDSAFGNAFGKTPDEFTAELRRFLSGGRYGYIDVELRDRGAEMSVEPASEANVEFALGRLAAVSGNVDLARRHASRVLELAPTLAAGHEILALAARDAGDDAALEAALDHAIELRSRDAWVYTAKANTLLRTHWRDNTFYDDVLTGEVAGRAAALYMQALALRPRNDNAYTGFVTAVLNVDTVTPDQRRTIDFGRLLYPTNGLALVAQAAAEKELGNFREATRLLAASNVAPIELPDGYSELVDALHVKWVAEWVDSELAALTKASRFADARAFVDERLADARLEGPLRNYLEGVARDLPSMERFHAAVQMGIDNNGGAAIEMLEALVADPATSDSVRRRAEQVLEQLGR